MSATIAITLIIYATWASAYIATLALVRKNWVAAVVAAVGLPLVYFAHMLTVIMYFELAIWFAASEAEIDRIVGSDGAKLVFHGLIVSPACSLVIVLLAVAARTMRYAHGKLPFEV